MNKTSDGIIEESNEREIDKEKGGTDKSLGEQTMRIRSDKGIVENNLSAQDRRHSLITVCMPHLTIISWFTLSM